MTAIPSVHKPTSLAQQRLSGEAQQRIRDAYDEADLILLRVNGSNRTRYEAEHGFLPSERKAMETGTDATLESLETLFSRRVSFDDYCARGAAAIQLSEARLGAAGIVLRAILNELSRVATGIECWSAMQKEILDAIAHGFKLREIERQIVWGDLKKDPGFEGVTKPSGIPASLPRSDLRAAERRAWMNDRHPCWSLVEWRTHTGIAYETLKKFREGITTNRTDGVRSDLAKAEGVHPDTVPK